MASIDLRSDFLTRPTPQMLAAGAAAASELHFGLREDPRQLALEERLASMLGHQDALVFPTCTMANLTAALLLGRRGTRAVTQPEAHMLTSEAGGISAFAGLLADPLPGEAALPEIQSWRRAAAVGDEQKPPASLFVLENTHNRAGGVAIPAAYAHEVAAIGRAAGVGVHLDGSRIFNAAAALGVPVADLARGFDTVSLSLNKAFGAPIAAALAGSRELIERAVTVRQRLGGGIRPTGPDAAATLAGLDESHFVRTHALAATLAQCLAAIPGLRVEPVGTRTNIVVAEVVLAGLTAPQLRDRLAHEGLLVLAFDARRVRFITYRGITARDIETALEVVQHVMRGASVAS
jgi:threonine aldolase